VPYLVKGANVGPFTNARWTCWSGHLNKGAARHCTKCGDYRGTTAAQYADRVTKALRPGGPTLLGQAFATR
jgi:hypothetical protein